MKNQFLLLPVHPDWIKEGVWRVVVNADRIRRVMEYGCDCAIVEYDEFEIDKDGKPTDDYRDDFICLGIEELVALLNGTQPDGFDAFAVFDEIERKCRLKAGETE